MTRRRPKSLGSSISTRFRCLKSTSIPRPRSPGCYLWWILPLPWGERTSPCLYHFDFTLSQLPFFKKNSPIPPAMDHHPLAGTALSNPSDSTDQPERRCVVLYQGENAFGINHCTVASSWLLSNWLSGPLILVEASTQFSVNQHKRESHS
jgi:hypothetical protein